MASTTKGTKDSSLFLALCAGLCYAGPVQAQLVDYGSLQALFGEPVTTSATGVAQRASDVPVDMTIITADDIRHSGTRSVPQIIGLYVPGVDVLRTADNSYDIGMRGYQQPFQSRLLVLLDGRQVFVDDYSRTIWDNLPVNVDDIRQIEVIKGASSAFSSLYGSNAVDGVINIITYSPLYDKDNVANLTAGTQSTISADGTATLKGDNWGNKFTIGGLNADEFDTPRDVYDEPAYKPLHSYAVDSAVFQVTPKFQVDTNLDYSESRSNTADSVDDFVIGNQKTTSYSGGVGFNWQTPYGVITNNNYFNDNESVLEEVLSSEAPYNQKTQLFVSQLQDQFSVGSSHTFRLGLEYRYQDFIYGYGQELEPINPDLRENNFSVNGMWLWQISDKLSLTNAFRVDNQRMDEAGQIWAYSVTPANEYTQFNTAWSANSGIVYHLSDQDTIGAGYGRAVQLPSMLVNGGNLLFNFGPPGFNGAIDSEGNPYIKPTIVQNYEIDFTHKIPEVASSVKFSPYYNYTKDIVDPFFNAPATITDSVTTYQPELSENVGTSYGYGAELEVKGNKDGFRWDASYSFSFVHDDATVITTNDYQDSAPENHFRLLLGYSTGPWEFDANGQYLSWTQMLRESVADEPQVPTYVSGYYSLGARVGYEINDHFTIALMGTNLSKTYTEESPYPEIDRQIFLSLTGKL